MLTIGFSISFGFVFDPEVSDVADLDSGGGETEGLLSARSGKERQYWNGTRSGSMNSLLERIGLGSRVVIISGNAGGFNLHFRACAFRAS